MFLDFSTIPEISVPHFKGGQGQALVRKFEDEQGKILILTLPAGSTIELEFTQLDPSLEQMVRECLDYGTLRGIGGWRNSGKGRYTWEEIK